MKINAVDLLTSKALKGSKVFVYKKDSGEERPVRHSSQILLNRALSRQKPTHIKAQGPDTKRGFGSALAS